MFCLRWNIWMGKFLIIIGSSSSLLLTSSCWCCLHRRRRRHRFCGAYVCVPIWFKQNCKIHWQVNVVRPESQSVWKVQVERSRVEWNGRNASETCNLIGDCCVVYIVCLSSSFDGCSIIPSHETQIKYFLFLLLIKVNKLVQCDTPTTTTTTTTAITLNTV